MEKHIQKIAPNQFGILVMFFTVGSSILLIPRPLIAVSKQDGWIAGTLGLGLGLLVIWLYLKIIKLSPDTNLYKLMEKAFGKILGKVVSVCYFFFIFLLTCEVLSNLGDFLTTQIMVETPKIYLHLLFLFPIVYGARQGIETIARSAQVVLPTFLIMIIFMVVALIPQGDIANLEPIFGEGVKSTINGSLSILTVPFLELFIFFVIAPHVTKKEKIKKAFLLGGLTGGSILIIITFLVILVLGPHFSSQVEYPTYLLSKKINIANFLQRLEVVAAAVWVISLFYKVIICFHSTAIGLRELIGLKGQNLLIHPLSIVVLYFSVTIYPNVAFFVMFIEKVVLSYTLLFGLVIPLAVYIILKVKSKKRKK